MKSMLNKIIDSDDTAISYHLKRKKVASEQKYVEAIVKEYLNSLGLADSNIANIKGDFESKKGSITIDVPGTEENTYAWEIKESIDVGVSPIIVIDLDNLEKQTGIKTYSLIISGQRFETKAANVSRGAENLTSDILNEHSEININGKRYDVKSKNFLKDIIETIISEEKKETIPEQIITPDITVTSADSDRTNVGFDPNLEEIIPDSNAKKEDEKENIKKQIERSVDDQIKEISNSLYTTYVSIKSIKGKKVEGSLGISDLDGDFKTSVFFGADYENGIIKNATPFLDMVKNYYGINKYEVDFGPLGTFKVESKDPKKAISIVLAHILEQDPAEEYTINGETVTQQNIPVIADKIIASGKMIKKVDSEIEVEGEFIPNKAFDERPWTTIENPTGDKYLQKLYSRKYNKK